MDIVVSLIAFFALVASWFVLPSTPRSAGAVAKPAAPEGLAQAA